MENLIGGIGVYGSYECEAENYCAYDMRVCFGDRGYGNSPELGHYK